MSRNKICSTKIRIWCASVSMAMLIGGISVSAQAYFEDFANGVRPSGMGEVFVPIADDANAIIFNPAGLARMVDLEFTGMYSDLYSNLNAGLFTEAHDRLGYNYAALAVPLQAIQGSLGVGWTQFSSTFYKENALALAYGKRIWEPYMMEVGLTLDLGITVKLLNWVVTENDVVINPNNYPEYLDRKKTKFTLDAGLLIKLHQEFTLGFSLANIIPADMGITIKEEIPLVYRFGVAYQLSWEDLILESICPMFEIVQRENEYTLKFGIESWWWDQVLAFRAGVNTERITSGFSFCYPWVSKTMDLQLDYAFSYPFYVYDTLGSHRAGITIRWVLPKSELDADVARAMESAQAASTVVQSLSIAKVEAQAAAEALKQVSQAILQNDLKAAEKATKLAAEKAEKTRLAAETTRALAVEISINFLPRANEAERAAQCAAKAAEQAQMIFRRAVGEREKSLKRTKEVMLKIPEKYQDKIIIGVETRLYSEFESLQEVLLKTAHLKEYLEKQVELSIEWKFITAPALRMAFKDGELDIFVSYGADVKEYYRSNIIKPVLTAQTHFKDSQQCCLIIRENDTISKCSDLRGKKLGYSNDKLIAKLKTYFFNDQTGFAPANYFARSIRFKNSQASLIALQLGDVDAVVEFEFALDIYAKMDHMSEQDIKVLALSPARPNVPIFRKLSKSVQKNRQMNKIIEALGKYHLEPGSKPVLEQLGIDRFIPYQEQKYKNYLLQD
jgi:ABC-type phosphate/phosphonate transport system substrate-binding protein